MSGRTRKPTANKAATSATKKKTVGQHNKGKKGKASPPAASPNDTMIPVEDEEGPDFEADPDEVAFDGPGFDPSSNRLYCVCLGIDDGSPMLQCEGCNNWFHFRCIDLTPAAAMNIDSYFCEICTEVGAGVTQLKPPKRAQESTLEQERPVWFDNGAFDEQDDDHNNSSQQQQSQLWDADYEMDQAGESGGEEGQGQKRKGGAPKALPAAEFFKPTQSSQSSRKRKKQKAEGMSSEDDTDDGDFDYDEKAPSKKRAAPKTQPKPRPAPPQKTSSGSHTAKAASSSSSSKKETNSAKTQASAAAAATRKQCTGTLIKVLEPVFAPSAGNATNARARAEDFAKQVEAQVFEHFSDPDGQPKQKYLTKIRQLLFNLKTSELLRTRVALDRVPPAKLANLSMKELLTPEQRAMADSVRAKSLKDSVKQDVDPSQPRIRMTHKGQEVVGDDQSSAMTFGAGIPDKSSHEADRTVASHSREGSFAQSPPLATADQVSDARSPSHPAHTAQENGEERTEEAQDASRDRSTSPTGSASAEPESKPRPKVQFDFDSVWGSLQSPPANSSSQLDTIGAPGPQSPVDVSQSGAADDDDAYDPFDFGKADDAHTTTTPPLSPPTNSRNIPNPPAIPKPPAIDPCVSIQGFSQIWSGDVFMPDEGGFPARAVQVGGRPLGDAPLVWQSLVPSRMVIEGRLPTKNATDYLVQCSFAPTREIIVLALMPTEANGLSLEQAQAKQQYFIDMFVRRDRNGVVPPAAHRRQLVKDCYIVPLKAAEESLPEYIELLDEHALGDKGERKSDLLLAVFVLQKGLMPSAGANNPSAAAGATAAPPLQSAPTPVPSIPQPQATSSSVAGFGGSPFPISTSTPTMSSKFGSGSAPSAAAAAAAAAAPPPTSTPFDPAALSSLIDPNVLASLVANASAAALSNSNQSQAPLPPADPYYHSAAAPSASSSIPPPGMPPPYAQRQFAEESRFNGMRDRPEPPPSRPYPPYGSRDRDRSPPLRHGRDGPPRGGGGGRGRGRGGFRGHEGGFRGRRGGPPRGR